MGRRQMYTAKQRAIIFKVITFFEREKEHGKPLIPLVCVYERAREATGVSKRTLQRIKNDFTKHVSNSNAPDKLKIDLPTSTHKNILPTPSLSASTQEMEVSTPNVCIPCTPRTPTDMQRKLPSSHFDQVSPVADLYSVNNKVIQSSRKLVWISRTQATSTEMGKEQQPASKINTVSFKPMTSLDTYKSKYPKRKFVWLPRTSTLTQKMKLLTHNIKKDSINTEKFRCQTKKILSKSTSKIDSVSERKLLYPMLELISQIRDLYPHEINHERKVQRVSPTSNLDTDIERKYLPPVLKMISPLSDSSASMHDDNHCHSPEPKKMPLMPDTYTDTDRKFEMPILKMISPMSDSSVSTNKDDHCLTPKLERMSPPTPYRKKY